MSILKNRDFLKISDFSGTELSYLLNLSVKLKKLHKSGQEPKLLNGKKIVLIFEKDSTRTRCAFESAAMDQGALTTYLGPSGSQLGKKESFADTARVLERMYDGIEYRGFSQKNVELLAEYAKVPVWNGLTDEAHPTQILADFLTMLEHCPKPLTQMKIAYLGDARFNMGNSLMMGAAKLGLDYRSIAPDQLQTSDQVYEAALKEAKQSKAKITRTPDLAAGVLDCDFIYTDVWVSMGEPEETWNERINLLLPYQVNARVMAMTNNPNAKFLHCLPAFHDMETAVAQNIKAVFGLEGLEVCNDVFESQASVVFDQAENRMHTIKAVMLATLIDLPPNLTF